VHAAVVDSGMRVCGVQLVKLQAAEMDALKLEISVLRRKGGHIYTQRT
jgi:hypothetical protein